MKCLELKNREKPEYGTDFGTGDKLREAKGVNKEVMGKNDKELSLVAGDVHNLIYFTLIWLNFK